MKRIQNMIFLGQYYVQRGWIICRHENYKIYQPQRCGNKILVPDIITEIGKGIYVGDSFVEDGKKIKIFCVLIGCLDCLQVRSANLVF